MAFHGIEGFRNERGEMMMAQLTATCARQNAKHPRNIKASQFLLFEDVWKNLEAEVDPVRAEIEHFTKAFGSRIEIVTDYRKRVRQQSAD